MSNPKVTVLMAVYNGEDFLREAVESILQQTYSDFEFLVIDDGSTDNTSTIIKSYDDQRIRLVKNIENIGLTKSLNNGLQLSRGAYIARMDADEISLPNRFAEQVEFLDSNKGIGCCGTLARIFGNHDSEWRYPLDHDRIKVDLLFHSCLVHASVMLRQDVLKKHDILYDEECICAQDYELWVRLSNVTRLANLDSFLLLHRIHNSSIGVTYTNLQIKIASRIRSQQLEHLGISFSEEEADLHHRLGRSLYESLGSSLCEVHRWLIKIKTANHKRQVYHEPALSEILGRQLLNVVRMNKGTFLCRFLVLFNSQLSPYLGLSFRQRFALLRRERTPC
jgi:glycosyltransferase involved in cell wall biosynthesis